MANIRCNHCKIKFVFNFKLYSAAEKQALLRRFNVEEIEDKYYCSECVATIGKFAKR